MSGEAERLFDNSWQALLAPGRARSFFELQPLPAFAVGDDFSPARAFWLAELSRLVYSNDLDLRARVLAEVGWVERCTAAQRSAHGAVFGPRDGSCVVVAFRGTDDLRDWLANLRALPVRWPRGGSVHRGFRRALAKVWRPLRRELARADAPVVCTGHSLGGAMALLAASLLRADVVYTFGAPRAGDQEFAATLADTAVHRVVNGSDVVVRVPPAGPPLGFCHVGETHRIGRPRAADAPEPELPERDDRRWFDPAPFLADHAPVNYTAALSELAWRG